MYKRVDLSTPFIRRQRRITAHSISSVLLSRGKGGPLLEFGWGRCAVMRERDASKSPEKRLATLIRSRFARERMRFVPGLDLKGLVFTTDLGIVRHLRFNGDLWEVVLGIEVAKLQNLSLNLDETLGKDCSAFL